MNAPSADPLVLVTHRGPIALNCPPDLRQRLALIYAPLVTAARPATLALDMSESSPGRYLAPGATNPLSLGELIIWLTQEFSLLPSALPAGCVALHAAVLSWETQHIVLLSHLHIGKSSLAAWLIDQGFSYSGDGVVMFDTAEKSVQALPLPLIYGASDTHFLSELAITRDAPSVIGSGKLAVAPHPSWTAGGSSGPVALFVYVTHGNRDSLEIKALAPSLAHELLAKSCVDPAAAVALQPQLAKVAAEVPMLAIRFADFPDLTGIADVLLRSIVTEGLSAETARRFLEGLQSGSSAGQTAKPLPIPAPTPRRGGRKLTIAMATYDDYDGAYFSIQAIRMFHPEVAADIDFLVLDNHPDGPCSEALKKLEGAISNYRYVPVSDVKGTWARYRAFDESESDFVMIIDSHVFVVPGAMTRLLTYLEANPTSPDLLQGPLLTDDFQRMATHLEPQWRGGFFGTWDFGPADSNVDAPPFDIPMQGLGLSVCRRAAWPGINPQMSGFGAEEGYVHEKFRQRGGRTLCLPFLRWLHRFERPMGVPYRNAWEDRVRNYLIGHAELGLPLEPIRQHYTEFLGEAFMQRVDEMMAG